MFEGWGAAAAGAAVVGAAASSASANKAASAQKGAAKDANATQLQMYNQQREDQEPWRQAGGAALSQLQHLMGLGDGAGRAGAYSLADMIDTTQGDWKPNADLYASSPEYREAWDDFYSSHFAKYGANPNYDRGSGNIEPVQQRLYNSAGLDQSGGRQTSTSNDPEFGSLTKSFTLADFQKDPGYQFRMDEGLKGVQSSAAARGGLLNGGTLKALNRYGQDFASNEYGNAYNRFNNDQSTRFNRLSTIAGLGQTANNTLANAGSNYANNVSNNQLAVGNANAASAIATGNAVSNGVNNVTSYYTMKNLFGNQAA